MRVATTIFTFGGGCGITRRHLPIWREFTDDLLLVFPHDDPCVIEDTDMVAHEVSNKYGMPCLRRQLFGMRHALRFKAECYVFIEYDGFLLRRPEFRPGVQGNLFHDAGGKYASAWFPHFPWIFDSESLRAFLDAATFEPFGRGFVDRWLAGQCDRLKLPIHDLQASGEGFSRNTIQHEDEKLELLRRVQDGAYAIHGVKTSSLLRRVLEAAGRADLAPAPEPEKKRGLFSKRS